MVVGGFYPGMETSMDFGVLLMGYQKENSNCGRWLLSRHGDKHMVCSATHSLLERRGGRWLLSRHGDKHGFWGATHGL